MGSGEWGIEILALLNRSMNCKSALTLALSPKEREPEVLLPSPNLGRGAGGEGKGLIGKPDMLPLHVFIVQTVYGVSFVVNEKNCNWSHGSRHWGNGE